MSASRFLSSRLNITFSREPTVPVSSSVPNSFTSSSRRVSSAFSLTRRGSIGCPFDQPDTPERHRLFRQLKSELDLHAAVEDLHVYRVFQQAEPTRDEAHEALEAHRKIKILLDELEAAPVYDQPKFQELQKLVETHVATEENEMFRKTQAIMTPQEAEALGVTVETAKQAISHNAPRRKAGHRSKLKKREEYLVNIGGGELLA
jgi:hypothetical protein